MVVLAFAFFAGLVTVAAPCILPVLPILLSGGSVHGHWRPWGIILGVVVSFSIFTLSLSWLVQQLGLSPNVARNLGILLLGLIGLLFLVPGGLDWFEGWVSRMMARSGKTQPRKGFGGALILGVSLGAIWTPCAGPILASVVTAAQTGTVTGNLVLITIAYAVGAALPMGLIAMLGQRIIARLRWFNRHAHQIQQVFGGVLIAMAIIMATNLDRDFQAWIIEQTPNWLPQLQGFEDMVEL